MTFSGFGQTAGTIGAAAGIFGPLGPAVGAAVGGIADIFVADDSARQQRKTIRDQNKYNKSVWRYENREQKRIYDFKVEEQNVAKRNTEANLQYQDDMMAQSWDYKMGIRDYEFDQMNRAYDKTVQQANQQLDFNELAFDQANKQQDRYLQEQMQGIAFDEQQTLLNFEFASLGLDLTARKTIAEANLLKEEAAGKADLSGRQILSERDRALERIESTSRLAEQKADLSIQQTTSARDRALERIDTTSRIGEQKAALSSRQVLSERGRALERIDTALKFSQKKGDLSLGQIKAERDRALERIESTSGFAKQKADLSRRQTTAAQARALERIESTSRFGLQRTALEELKLKGTAAARGQAGRSAAKVQQGIGAEAGAQKAVISKEEKLAKGAAKEEAFFARAQVLQDLIQTQEEANLAKQAAKEEASFSQGRVLQDLMQTQEEAILAKKGAKEEAVLKQAQVAQDLMQIQEEARLGRKEAREQAFFTQAQVSQNLRQTQEEARLSKGEANEKAFFAQARVLQDLSQTQARVAQQLMFAEEGVELDYKKLNDQFQFDVSKLAASKDNLTANDQVVRDKIALQLQQADMNARNSITLKPEIAPPIPEPLTLPRPEWPKIFKPEERPEPVKKVSYQGIDPYVQLASGVLGGIASTVDLLNNQNQPTVGGGNVGVLGNIFGGNTPSLGVADLSGFDLNPGWFTP